MADDYIRQRFVDILEKRASLLSGAGMWGGDIDSTGLLIGDGRRKRVGRPRKMTMAPRKRATTVRKRATTTRRRRVGHGMEGEGLFGYGILGEGMMGDGVHRKVGRPSKKNAAAYKARHSTGKT